MGWRTSVRPRWIFSRPRRFPRSREPVFICSDMAIEELAQDMEFSKKWMLGTGGNPQKGTAPDMVHDLNRPFGEMMLGLESWIPLYMTGQIMPWYLPGRQNAVYGHLLFCSGAVAVEGEMHLREFCSWPLPVFQIRQRSGILQTARRSPF